MNSHLHHQCSSVDLAISRQVGVKSPLHCSPAAYNNNKNVKTNACDSVQAAISRQVGINSPLYCEACSAAARPASSHECDPAQQAISRQVRWDSPLTCR